LEKRRFVPLWFIRIGHIKQLKDSFQKITIALRKSDMISENMLLEKPVRFGLTGQKILFDQADGSVYEFVELSNNSRP